LHGVMRDKHCDGDRDLLSRTFRNLSNAVACAIPSACHPYREIHLLSADAVRSYCCMLHAIEILGTQVAPVVRSTLSVTPVRV